MIAFGLIGDPVPRVMFSGGVLWFIFTDESTKRPENDQVHDIRVYAQIENAARLTVRLGNWETTQIRSPLMYEFLHLAQSVSETFPTVTVDKEHAGQGQLDGIPRRAYWPALLGELLPLREPVGCEILFDTDCALNWHSHPTANRGR